MSFTREHTSYQSRRFKKVEGRLESFLGWASEYFGEGTEGKSVGEAYDGKEFLSDACY